MMAKSLYCTSDLIGTSTGGGIVTFNELEALKCVSDEVFILSAKELSPSKFRQPESPFLYDYFALSQIKNKHFDLAHFYSGTFSNTISWLKSRGTKVCCTIAAHNRKVSIEEFGRLGLEYPFHHIKDDDLWSIYFEGCSLANVIIAPSKLSADFLRAEGCKNVVVIPHGYTMPDKVEPIPEKFDVAYLGVFGPDKGLVYLIQAWSMLNYNDSKLILAGRGTEQLEPMIRGLVNQGEFCLLGFVENRSEVFNAASVMIQPSVCEGFGIPVVEAMAHGRPVIATEGAGASELIDNGINGFVVPIRDPRAIADKIDYLKRNPNKVKEMGKNARRKSKDYTWDKIRRKYIEIFSSLSIH